MGAAHKEEHVDAGHTAAEVIGGVELANGATDDGRDGVTDTGEGEEEVGEPERGGKAKEGGGETVEGDAEEEVAALMIAGLAAGEDESGQNGANWLGGGEGGVAVDTGVEDAVGDEGEHGAGRAKKSGPEVDEHGTPD